MCAFFILSGFYCYIRWRHGRKSRFFILSLTSYILALMTKEIALILPMLIITYEFIYNKNFWKERKGDYFRISAFSFNHSWLYFYDKTDI